ncbi:hypothetical protein BGX38DRAFT_1195156 [Terfezia claveryi]|nr:hypothetical protein BGX38DRAFT_1195156 [Terfezia claveryi]
MQTDPLTEAERFLSPVLDRAQHRSLGPSTLIGRLSTTLPGGNIHDGNELGLIIAYALSLVQKIHAYLLSKYKSSPSPEDIFSPKDRRIIIALLDLLALEGIYPCLTPGVGVPLERRAKAIIPPSSKIPSGGLRSIKKISVLTDVILSLSSLLQNDRGEVVDLLKDRCLVDLVAGYGELAFNPSQDHGLTEDEKKTWEKRWESLIEEIPTPQLLLILMSLVHPQCPRWFLAPVSAKLSTIPIHRPNAVRHILQLFLSAPTPVGFGTQFSGTPDIPLDALAKAARIIGSVPKSISPEEWFHTVCPQLIELVHGGVDEGLKRTAAYVIAELLAKKGIEKVIDKEVIVPILKALDPEYGQDKDTKEDLYTKSIPTIPSNKGRTSSKALLKLENLGENTTMIQTALFKPLISIIPDEDAEMDANRTEGPQDTSVLITESTLLTALSTLAYLLQAHPTPLIPQRLLKPVFLSLWGLMCVSKEKNKAVQWSELPRTLLINCIKTMGANVTVHPTSMGEKKKPLEQILYNLGYTGGEGWEFGNGEYGGIEIRERKPSSKKLGMEAVDGRVVEFMRLLQDIQVGEDGSAITALFLHILSDWLGVGGSNNEGEDPVRVLARLKILQQILTNYTDKLGKKPTETLQVIINIINEYVSSRKALQEHRMKQLQAISSPSMKGLGEIIDPETSAKADIRPNGVNDMPKRKYIGQGDEDEDDRMDEAAALASSEDSDSMERITITLSLLSSMIANPETQLTEQDERLLHTLTPSLHFLSSAPAYLVDPSISSLSINISSFLSLFTPNTVTASTTGETPQFSLLEQQKTTYKTALSYATDPLVPIRAHGLYFLRQLILARSPVLDIHTTLRLLISMIKDIDSFVYLNVVKCLQSLSEKHPSTVVRLLVESYMDDSGVLTLDERLRVGEALLGAVEKEGRMFVGEIAHTVARGMIEIISRRRQREDKSEKDKGDEVKESLKAMKPPKNPYFGKVEDVDEEEEALDEVGNPLPSHAKLKLKHQLHIIRNWLPPPGTHLEDVRIRASALSILSAAVETNSLGIGAGTCEMAMDISLAILQLETTPEKGILRRAAMVCLAGHLKNYDQPGVGWVRSRLNQVKRVVEYVRGVDSDGLVREQARQVTELVDGVWMEILGGEKSGYGGSMMDGPVIGEMGLEQIGR